MRRYRNIILAAAVIVAVLAGAWVFGGNFNKPNTPAPPPQTAQSPALSESVTAAPPSETDAPAATPSPGATASETPATESPPSTPEPSATPNETPTSTETPAPPSPTQDEYQTDPVPEGKPLPVEPQDATVGGGAFTVTLSVRCNNILNNMNLLDKEKHELVPADGVIFPATVVTVYEGESVFNVLQREMKRAKIHMEFMNTPIYNSAYIEGIGNLYEFDVGELSGWMYAVNGWYPNYGCSRYQLTAGDVIEWSYTCDLGRDLGQTWIDGGQRDE